MLSGKKKSSGWRAWDKRRTPAQRRAKRAAADAATARHDCNGRALWCSCPLRQCRRVRCCGGEPTRCQRRSRPPIAPRPNAAPQASSAVTATAALPRPAAPVLSAAEAAAAIKASIAAMPPEPFGREELEVVYRDGGIYYLPRKR